MQGSKISRNEKILEVQNGKEMIHGQKINFLKQG